MKLNHEHIEYILTCLEANTTKVGNIKIYLLTTLYNASMTISSYYMVEGTMTCMEVDKKLQQNPGKNCFRVLGMVYWNHVQIGRRHENK